MEVRKVRVAIFIDGSNFYHGLKTYIGNTKIDFTKFAELLLGRLEKRVVRVDREELVKTFGEKIAEKIIEKWGEAIVTFVEKGIDINLAADMLRLAYNNAYDTAILVTGDADFVAADARGFHIRRACDKFIPLDKDFLASCFRKTNE